MKSVPVAVTRLATLVAILAVLGCSPPQEETRVRFSSMGTLVEVTVFGHPPDSAHEAISEIESLFADLEKRWDPWDGGELAELNSQLATGASAQPSRELAEMLGRATALNQASDGLFEPSIGSLTRLWGFSSEESTPTSPPTSESLAESLASVVPLSQLWTDDGRLKGPPGLAIDLGGFAKGEAVDIAIAMLRERGIDNAIVNAGGDLRAIGRHGDRDWRIGVRQPRGEGILAAIHISGDESVFTSGDYERFFVADGSRYHHILDPRNGLPASDTTSVTVIADNAALADAAATALFVAGPDEWAGVAGRMGLSKVMLVDASGNIHLSPEMESRVWLQGESHSVQIEEIP